MSIYFLHAPTLNAVKIGHSERAALRAADLARQCPAPVELIGEMEGGAFLEARLQRYLANHRRHGEWFNDDPDVLAIARGERPDIIEALAVGDTDETAIRDALEEIGTKRAEHLRLRAEAAELAHEWVPKAIAAEIPVTEIAKLAHMTRASVYTFLGER